VAETNTAPPTTQQKKDRKPVFIGKKRAYLGTGRRKSAVARVYLTEGNGTITINGRTVEQFFTEEKDRNSVYGPLLVTDVRNRVDAMVRVSGGGFTGQAGAVCQGLARAIKNMFNLTVTYDEANPPDEAIITMAKKLRDSGYLTRDSRMKERKKYGKKGARKSFQFSKR